jgi:hypothetical protein
VLPQKLDETRIRGAMYLFWQAKLVQFCATVKGASWTNPDEMTPLNHER